jgi:excisionase family DNA binding protein
VSATTANCTDARVVELLERIAAGVDGLRAAVEASHAAPSALLTRDQLAELLQVDVRTLRRLELLGSIPNAIEIGGLKRWRRADVDRWLTKRSVP